MFVTMKVIQRYSSSKTHDNLVWGEKIFYKINNVEIILLTLRKQNKQIDDV